MTQAETPLRTHARPDFRTRLAEADSAALRAESIDTLMLNVTRRCNLACAHCHQASSPSTAEEMSREAMLLSVQFAETIRPRLIDITGGEPELWPHLCELISLLRTAEFPVRVRTNLVALAQPEARDLPAFFARKGVALLASLPASLAGEAPEAAVAVLRVLAEIGYGSGSGLTLDLAYNPPLGELPRGESALLGEHRAALEPLGVRFDTLLAIANVPVGRFGNHLRAAGSYDEYSRTLADAFNPAVARSLACRSTIDVGWDGTLSDCDFNLGAGLGLAEGPRTVTAALEALRAADGAAALRAIRTRRIAFGPHCFACTAGAGSG